MEFDVVIPLGKGSRADNAELKYALRSLAKYGRNLGKVFIIGEKPEIMNWSERLVHVPFVERHGAYINVWEKLFFASQDDRISERFLFTNDDIYVMKPFDAGDVPYYCRPRELSQMPFANMVFAEIPRTYQKMMRRTLEALNRRKMTCYHFGTHQPVNFEKSKVAETFAEFATELYSNKGLSFRCCYGNQHQVERIVNPTVVLKKIVDRKFTKFAVASHEVLEKSALIDWLEGLFPMKSEFEASYV
jgi:hypothetical protein